MQTSRRRSVALVFLLYLLGLVDCAGQELTVRRGENAALECYGPRDATDILLRWTKPDLHTDGYVFYFKDGQFQEHLQKQLFKGRLKLKDPQMKAGNFSVILQNVSMTDAGTYECYGGYNNQKPQLMNSTNLKVEEPDHRGRQSGDEVNEGGGEKSGSVGLSVGLSVLAVLFLLGGVVGFMIYRRCRNQSNPDYRPPREQGLKCFQQLHN